MRADATGLRRAFVLLTALRWLPIGFITPLHVLLPLSRGLTLGQVGITMACGAATAALLELPTGGLADAVGRRSVLGASSRHWSRPADVRGLNPGEPVQFPPGQDLRH